MKISVSFPEHGSTEVYAITNVNSSVKHVKQLIFSDSDVVSPQDVDHYALFIDGLHIVEQGMFRKSHEQCHLLIDLGEMIPVELHKFGEPEIELEMADIDIEDTVTDLDWCGALARKLGGLFKELQRFNGEKGAADSMAALDELAALVTAPGDPLHGLAQIKTLCGNRRHSTIHRDRWSGIALSAAQRQSLSNDAEASSSSSDRRKSQVTTDLLSFMLEDQMDMSTAVSEDAAPRTRTNTIAPFGRTPLVAEREGWRLELCNEKVKEPKLQIERAENEEDQYSQYFAGQEHENFVGEVDGIGPVSVSVIEDVDEYGKLMIRALIRTKYGEQMKLIDGNLVRKKFLKKKRETTMLLKAVSPMFDAAVDRKIAVRRVLAEGDIEERLTQIDKLAVVKTFKFGVLYRKAGQQDENDMFKNRWEDCSPEFCNFLNVLGDTVDLKGFSGFRGGLDVKSGSTGTQSVYRAYQQYEIMFHVAPMLPYYEQDEQQLERKRHLGNDIVLVVFQDKEEPFVPATVKSEFIHVIFVVTPVGNNYRLGLACQDKIPFFGPALPADPTFTPSQFREFFFTKAINSELAALRAPAFKSKLQGARARMLQGLAKAY